MPHAGPSNRGRRAAGRACLLLGRRAWPGGGGPCTRAAHAVTAGTAEGRAFIWAEIDGDEDEASDELARDYDIPALPGRHFHSRTPQLRIPFGGRPVARAALLERLGNVALTAR